MLNCTGSSKVFSTEECLGIAFIVESAAISAAAVLLLLLYLLVKAIKDFKFNRSSADWGDARRRYSDDSTHVHHYFLNLMLSELVQAIGGLMSGKWVSIARVAEGPLCTAQGVFKQMGDVGVALTSLAIALHTFCVLVFRWRPPTFVAYLVIGVIWLFIILIVAVGYATHKNNPDAPYYGDTGHWCWITDKYTSERIALEYFWLWMAAFSNIVIYLFLALIFWGIVIIEDNKVHIHGFHRKNKDYNDVLQSNSGTKAPASSRTAARMLFYPAVYVLSVFPIAVARWLSFAHKNVPFPATVFASILFQLSGLFNVILFTVTRPRVIKGGRNEVMESLDKDGSVSSLEMRTSRAGASDHRRNVSEETAAHAPDFDERVHTEHHFAMRGENHQERGAVPIGMWSEGRLRDADEDSERDASFVFDDERSMAPTSR